jgi:CheY-like chemotaxis protein
VSSEPGRGATFWFTASFGVAERSCEPGPDLAGKRLLVVDDNATNRRVLQLQLERHGCRVQLASDAAQAMATLTQSEAPSAFDAILTDQCMPVTDGVALTEWIRSRTETRALPVLLLGSQIENRDLLRGRGVTDVLLKPVRESQLVRALHALFSTRALDPVAGRRPAAGDATPSSGAGRVLVVEDNPVNQRVAVLMLKKLGYSPEVAANGAEALRALERGGFNAILMDCQMPEMDGFEAARAIRKRPWPSARTPIIALTANALPGEREKCVAAGMNDYLAKPLTFELLSDKLREWS